MAVRYKFKSAKDFDTIAIDGHFISVGMLKDKIFESKHYGKGADFNLVVTNAQTNEDYHDDATLIPKNTALLIRRIPGQPRKPLVTQSEEPKIEIKVEDSKPLKNGFTGADSSALGYPEDTDWDEFGNDLYAIPETTVPVQSSNVVQDAAPPTKEDEDSKIQALIGTPAIDWQHTQPSGGFGSGRGYGRGMGGRMMGRRGYGRGGFENVTPPPGYVCRRCKVPGHFIQHCPTNGDPNYDIKTVKPPTGIPKSMLMPTPDGSYALPSGAVAVLKPNEAAFQKEIEGLPSTRSVGDIPPELCCPLCKEVMKDAVFKNKCCFRSYCDKCIRDYIMSKSSCICGATNVLADDLLPNKTLRDAINRLLESNNSSAENAGSTIHVQDMESSLPRQKKPSPTVSAVSKGEERPQPPQNEDISKVKGMTQEGTAVIASVQTTEKGKAARVTDVSEATHDSISVKEPASQESAPQAEEEVQQKVTGEAGKKKKKKKGRPSLNEMQWKTSQGLVPENSMMPPMGPAAYDPYWNVIQPGVEAFAPSYAGPMPYMGYGVGPFDVPFPGALPQDPFVAQGFGPQGFGPQGFGPQGFVNPAFMAPPVFPPQRDPTNFGMGFNAGSRPIMSREEFEARKADLRRKHEIDRQSGREYPKHPRERDYPRDRESLKDREHPRDRDYPRDREFPKDREYPNDHDREFSKDRDHAREVGASAEISSMKLKHRPPPSTSTAEDHHRRHRHERPSSPERSSARDVELPRPGKRKSSSSSDYHRHRLEPSSSKQPPSSFTVAEKPTSKSAAAVESSSSKHKKSVFARISFPEGEQETGGSKKRKVASEGLKDVNESSDEEDRHFKRKPSRYEPERDEEEEARPSKKERQERSSSRHR